jgi:hypothetical protein
MKKLFFTNEEKINGIEFATCVLFCIVRKKKIREKRSKATSRNINIKLTMFT